MYIHMYAHIITFSLVWENHLLPLSSLLLLVHPSSSTSPSRAWRCCYMYSLWWLKTRPHPLKRSVGMHAYMYVLCVFTCVTCMDSIHVCMFVTFTCTVVHVHTCTVPCMYLQYCMYTCTVYVRIYIHTCTCTVYTCTCIVLHTSTSTLCNRLLLVCSMIMRWTVCTIVDNLCYRKLWLLSAPRC